jgi:hypothetical protein
MISSWQPHDAPPTSSASPWRSVDGLAQRAIVAGALDPDRALVEIGACLGPLPQGLWPAVLSQVASHYVDR